MPVHQRQGRRDPFEMPHVVGDQNRPDRERVRGDHHVQLADRLPAAGQLVADVGIAVGGVGIPGQHPHDPEELTHPRMQPMQRRQSFQPIHELGARHLIDPTRLIDSASRVYGDLLDSLYGRLDPTDAERVVVLYDDDIVDVGDRAVRAIDSPGHAKHHLAFLDETSGLLFAGDALGVQLPDGGVLRPATPPADFDFAKAIDSMRRFSALRPAGIALTHYGLIRADPDDLLAEAETRLREWVGVAEDAYRRGEDIAEALAGEFAQQNDDIDEEQRSRIETLNGIHSNAAGLR